ncbi:MAG: DUF4124 domain-containing protein [Sedimenticola sp.]
MKKAVLLLLLLASFPVISAVYKWIGPDGSVHYSDVPQDGAEQIKLPEPTIYQQRLPGSRNAQEELADEEVPFSGYKKLLITSPENEQMVRSNEGNVSVALSLTPPLWRGHKFRVYLDGSEVSSALTTTRLELRNIQRGGHTLSALVVDQESRELIRSNYVRFYLRPSYEEGHSGETPASGSSGLRGIDAPQYAPQSTVPKGTDREEYEGADPLPRGQEQEDYKGEAELPKGEEQSDYEGDAPLPEGSEREEFRGQGTPPPSSVSPNYKAVPKNRTSPAFTPSSPGFKSN